MLSRLLKGRPNQLVEFLPLPNAGALAETLVSFANGDGGTILVGVSREGEVVEDVAPDDMEASLLAVQAECRPPVEVGWEQMEAPGGTVIAIRVPRSSELHTLADGRVLVRTGRENRPLAGQEVRQLAATKSVGDFESEPVPAADFDDLDPDVIQEYLDQRRERGGGALNRPLPEFLQEIGALDEDGQPTVTGLLLFGKRPQVYLPQSGLVFVHFVGTEPRGDDGLAGYGRREEIGGPLARMIERAWQVVWEEMRVGAVVKDLAREERAEYPSFAVREALVNAICHRDYRLRGRRIEVRMFDDRLEVISPGGLPGYITLDNIVDEHFSRNPRIVAGLFQWGYIEELGLGVDRMIEEMLRAGHPAPEFRDTLYSFTVTLHNLRERRVVPDWERSMNERQLRALQYLRENDSITNSEYRYLCPDVSAETLRLDLVDLREKGVILKVGAKRGTYYILK
ncbi:MAG: ATP-binding protein [Chloroflexota bacterium]|nr:ATP-binding protein [Chloroflexota bacterium]